MTCKSKCSPCTSAFATSRAGVTEGGGKGWARPSSGGGGEDGIAMKGAQSKVKWVGGHGVNGVVMAPRPPTTIVTPLIKTHRGPHIDIYI